MRVFVTGGTGLVGSRLVARLVLRGDHPVVLTRRYAAARQQLGPEVTLVEGDPGRAGEWMDSAGECDSILHLAGENVFARRWSTAFKQKLVDSRVQSTANLVEVLKQSPHAPDGYQKVLVTASAIGYYGPRGDEELDETAAPGDDFLARLCIDWEATARRAEEFGVRCAQVRVGIVLDKNGGALAKLLTPFKLGVGGPVAGGRQWMSWVHHEDLVNLCLLALDTAEAAGPLNGTAPNPVTNRDFSRALGRALHRPSLLPAPGWGLRVLLGEAASAVVTGQRVLPRRALELGYEFQYPTLDLALAEILGQPAK